MATMSFAERMRQARRLEILRLLDESAGKETSGAILYRALGDRGLECSMDQVDADLAWLAQRGLVACESVGGLLMAEITQAGLDTARGRERVPRVAEPLPARR